MSTSAHRGEFHFFNGFQKVNHAGENTLVTLPPVYYGSEPMFAPACDAKAEDDGYLLEVVYNAFEHRSELQILRTQDPADLVARLQLTHHLPHQFHGFFSTDVQLA